MTSSLRGGLPDLWREADPDDTNPEYLSLWREAWTRNGRETICDGPSLATIKLTIYRGQKKSATVGFAWTLDRAIAAKFAKSGGLRGRIPDGTILKAIVRRKDVYGYLTKRGESEIIIDPRNIWKPNERKTR